MTLNEHGTRTVSIRTTGHKRTTFTVMLGCLANGTKLSATCIFKLKKIPREELPRDINIRVNEKGWCNEEEMIWWINNVWVAQNKSRQERSLLVLDSFRGHLTDMVKETFRKNEIDIAVIPGGLTSKLELIKTSFKCRGISLAGDDQESNWLFNTDQLYHGQDIEITNLNDVETNSEDNVKCEYNNDWGCALIVISHMIPRGYVIIGSPHSTKCTAN